MHSVPATETAAANGFNSVMRTLGSTMAAAVIGVILSSHVVIVEGRAIPTAQAFQWSFALAAGVALTGAVLALLLPRRESIYVTASIPVVRG